MISLSAQNRANASISDQRLRAAQARQSRLQAVQVKQYDQTGKTLVTASTAADESVVVVKFVLTFIEEPHFTFGSALDPNQQVVPGSFPTANAFVLQWETMRDGPTVAHLGATLGIVTTGTVGQKLWVHYRFSGRAMSFNAGPSPTNDLGTA